MSRKMLPEVPSHRPGAILAACLVVGAALLPLPHTAAAGEELPEVAPELEDSRLQGTWRGPDTGNLRSVWTLQIRGREFRFDGPGPREWYEGNIALHEGTPNRIDLRILRCDCTYKESTSLGLYSLDGDRLTFIGAEPGYPRPEAFDSRGRTMQMHLDRIEPSGG